MNFEDRYFEVISTNRGTLSQFIGKVGRLMQNTYGPGCSVRTRLLSFGNDGLAEFYPSEISEVASKEMPTDIVPSKATIHQLTK